MSDSEELPDLGPKKPDGVIDDRWYWVQESNGDWAIARWSEYSGWFDGEMDVDDVITWKLIPLPEELP